LISGDWKRQQLPCGSLHFQFGKGPPGFDSSESAPWRGVQLAAMLPPPLAAAVAKHEARPNVAAIALQDHARAHRMALSWATLVAWPANEVFGVQAHQAGSLLLAKQIRHF